MMGIEINGYWWDDIPAPPPGRYRKYEWAFGRRGAS